MRPSTSRRTPTTTSGIRLLAKRRLRFSLVLVSLVVLLFAGRLFQIQGFDAAAYAKMAKDSGTVPVTTPATRGSIVDRNGAVLAQDVETRTLTADPKLTAARAPAIAAVLVDVLDEDRATYFKLIETLRTPDSRFVIVQRKVPVWKAEKIVSTLSDDELPGVFTQPESTRSYPGGTLAANVLGFTNPDGVGLQGLEQQFDKALTGTEGFANYEVSVTGQRIPMADNTVKPMIPGDTVRTTIDRDLQWYSDERLAEAVKAASADWGLAITMDVRTGQIVQLSQAPTFDAESRANFNDSTTVARFAQTVYEPGSVMKPVTMAALADQGKVSPDTKIVVPPSVMVDGFRIGDYWQHGQINLTAAGVIAKSSNLGTIVAAKQMSNTVMHDYLAKFGFGKTTGSETPGESRGLLTPAKNWSESNHATISFGQGISVTALQMIRAVGAIANNGVLVTPTLVEGLTKPDGSTVTSKPGKTERVVSAEAAKKVTRMMEAVVADDGTAPAAQIPGYRVAGKTGTAWRVNPATGTYIRGQNTVSFMGFAPADKPRFITYVVLDKPYAAAGGGSTAAPVFHDIMSMTLERFGVAPTGSTPPEIAQTW